MPKHNCPRRRGLVCSLVDRAIVHNNDVGERIEKPANDGLDHVGLVVRWDNDPNIIVSVVPCHGLVPYSSFLIALGANGSTIRIIGNVHCMFACTHLPVNYTNGQVLLTIGV